MIVHRLNPVLVSLGPLEIRYYSLFYIIGLAIAYLFIRSAARKKIVRLSNEGAIDYIVYLATGLLIGGRVLYFVFYNPSVFISDPLEILRLWNGGMSFHGGLIGGFAAAALFCRKHKLRLLQMADLTVVPLALALFLGRIGNFINGELYGRVWDGALCIDYSQNPHTDFSPKLCRYPSQLLESAKNLLIFAGLLVLRSKGGLTRGTLFYVFLCSYGTLRFAAEFFRQPDPQLGFVAVGLTMGQILCIFMVAGGIFGLGISYCPRRRNRG